MKNEDQLVSIIMPCYNYGRFIKDAVKSVTDQTYQKWELIIVNDGSTDNTKEILNKIKDPRMRVFNLKNSGVSAARNAGLEVARGDYICFLDADDIWLPKKLEIQVKALKNNPGCGFVCVNFTRFDDKGGSYGNFLEYCLQLKNYDGAQPNTVSEYKLGSKSFEILTASSEMPWYPTANMVRADVINDIRFPVGVKIGEDISFFLRVWLNTEAIFIPSILAKLRVHENNASKARSNHKQILIENFEVLFRNSFHPRFTKVINKRIGSLYIGLGYEYRKNGNITAAIEAYRDALSYKGTKILALTNMIILKIQYVISRKNTIVETNKKRVK